MAYQFGMERISSRTPTTQAEADRRRLSLSDLKREVRRQRGVKKETAARLRNYTGD